MKTIRERSDALAEKIAATDPIAVGLVADLIFEEFRDDWSVVVVTKSGIVGDYATGDYSRCQKYIQDLESWRSGPSHEKSQITLNIPGMGYGAPCPLGAIHRVLLLAAGESLPEELAELHLDKAEEFAAALELNGGSPSKTC